ncbi:hypothetical protein AVEN_174574-1 [Araneus ventricosus]|uniref:Uncharacterized protein n=1 Tax=Araneus ventricosus TaxID=182803 RepID=A0A4Y2V3Z6_ARAVE|nr:hypothetical protein AVEN_174574-1 [Araneus ventricosus]
MPRKGKTIRIITLPGTEEDTRKELKECIEERLPRSLGKLVISNQWLLRNTHESVPAIRREVKIQQRKKIESEKIRIRNSSSAGTITFESPMGRLIRQHVQCSQQTTVFWMVKDAQK